MAELGETVLKRAEKLVISSMKANDASHDASHAFRVRDLALSLAREEGLCSSPQTMRIIELAALLHDIGDYKYVKDPSEERIVEKFLEEEGIEEDEKKRILSIIKGMGFKEEVSQNAKNEYSLEFGVVQDADRLDAIGAIVDYVTVSKRVNSILVSNALRIVERLLQFQTISTNTKNNVLHDPNIKPRLCISKEDYVKKGEQTTINHFHEKLLKLKELMKTKAGYRRAEKRHKFMEDFLEEFYEEWAGRA
ncbi:hypothetical protein Scep_015955 [Stephania cephalantha]|uniref:HD domain-containing protein n=1 Tax=Stephania cephalantha TaxID=152367 RepID=A0AAP0NS57_9MAGN